jgi:integrase
VFTIRKIHAVLHSALSHAVKLNMIAHNQAGAVIKPRKPDKEMEILDESQISQLLYATKESRCESILHLAVTTGMRQVELLGLKWIDLDWIMQTIKVERQLVKSEQEEIQFASARQSSAGEWYRWDQK